jgi:hypothetical protein
MVPSYPLVPVIGGDGPLINDRYVSSVFNLAYGFMEGWRAQQMQLADNLPTITERHVQFVHTLKAVLGDRNQRVFVGDLRTGYEFYGGVTVVEIANLVTRMAYRDTTYDPSYAQLRDGILSIMDVDAIVCCRVALHLTRGEYDLSFGPAVL